MLGQLISAGTSLLGGFLNSNATKKANEQSAALARENIQLQKDFAQQGLTWKIDDAFRNADRVHPIYSMGASTPSFSPVSANFAADTSVGSAVASAGQDIGRAVHATATGKQRADAFTVASQKLSLEKGALENELLRTELASKNGRLRQNATPSLPMPGDAYLIPGQGNSDLIKNKPLEVAPGHPGQPSSEGGAIADTGYTRTTTGWAPVPSQDVKQRIEDNFVQERLWDIRNNVLPSFGMNFAPPPFPAPPGKVWEFHVPTQEYRLGTASASWWNRGFTARGKSNEKASSGW